MVERSVKVPTAPGGRSSNYGDNMKTAQQAVWPERRICRLPLTIREKN